MIFSLHIAISSSYKGDWLEHICPSQCPTEIVTSLSLGVSIPDDSDVGVSDTIPVTLEAGCNCTVANVAFAFGIDHESVGDLGMLLVAPDNTEVLLLLVAEPLSDANLVADNKITFDDSTLAKDPLTLGDTDPIPAGTYFAQGNFLNEIGADYPNPFGLGFFNGFDAAGNWTFSVSDFVQNGDTGTLESVELTITCE